MSWAILREFVRHPARTGAVAASSAALARAMVSEIGLASARRIVEYGPGTGVFTREILARKRPDAELWAFELNANLAAAFRARFPRVSLFEVSAAAAPDRLPADAVGQVDCIVCGLPWAAFSDAIQAELLAATLTTLRPGGRFATFAYLQGLLLRAGRRFRRRLHERFGRVETSPVVWRNLPPAFVYRCEKE